MSVYNRFTSDNVFITKELIKSNIWNSGLPSIPVSDLSDPRFIGTSVIQSGDITSLATNLIGYSFDESTGDFYPDYIDPDPAFQVIYAHRKGLGSAPYNIDNASASFEEGIFDYDSPAKSLYSQYRSLVYGDETKDFSFSGHVPDSIFIINFNRRNYKQSLATGSLQISFKDVENSSDSITLTDDSLTNPIFRTSLIGREYNIVSGSNGVSFDSNIAAQSQKAHNPLGSSPVGSYGLFYPDAGILIFNTDALIDSSAFPTDSIITEFQNLLSGGGTTTTPNLTGGLLSHIANITRFNNGIKFGGGIQLKAEEELNVVYYNIDIPNKDFNYSNSKTFQDKNNNVRINSMVDNPRVYITTIGLYNDRNELLAVAKLSKPIAKDFTKSLLFKVKLTF